MKLKALYIIALATFMGCDMGLVSPNSGNVFFSQGGSTTKFTVSGDYLYFIDNLTLSTFDIRDESEIRLVNKLKLNTIQLETIFPFGDKLYLGSTTGVLILDISTPAKPVFLSEYQHVVSCDPVVTDGTYAYVTLRSGNRCGQVDDELQIIDLANIYNPQVINRYSLSSPRGLAINGNILYVCDDGIKILDVSDVNNIQQLNHLQNIPANDVIYHKNQILVTADNGFYQFDVQDARDVNQIGQYTY
jgi:hypothetical protein